MGAREKGSTYERAMAEQLSKTFFPYKFKRVPLSGGWDKSLIVGDLVPWKNDNIAFFAFGIECKNHKTLDLRAWLRQARNDCGDKLQEPIVLFHINRRRGFPRGENFVAIEKKTLAFFMHGDKKIKYKDYTDINRWNLDDWLQETFADRPNDRVALFLSFEGDIIVVLRFSHFLGILNKSRVCNKIWSVFKKYL